LTPQNDDAVPMLICPMYASSFSQRSYETMPPAPGSRPVMSTLSTDSFIVAM